MVRRRRKGGLAQAVAEVLSASIASTAATVRLLAVLIVLALILFVGLWVLRTQGWGPHEVATVIGSVSDAMSTFASAPLTDLRK